MKLSILIVNYNGLQILPDCLASIQKHAPPGTEIVLADNGSVDGSPELVERKYPWVRVVRSPGNVGFAAGNNVAGRAATGDVILLLNPDTILLDDIEPALEAIRHDPFIGALTIKALEKDGREQPCVGRFPTPVRLAKLGTLFERTTGADPVQIDWVQGSFLITPRENWDALGGLDERYFMYAEDLDFCRRTRDRGLKVIYYPSLRYVHLGGFTRNRFADLIGGMRLYADKHFFGWTWVTARGVLISGCALRFARAIAYAVATPTSSNRTFVKVAARACWRVIA